MFDELEILVERWELLAKKCLGCAEKATNPYTQERYFAESGVYGVCADQLMRILKGGTK